MPQIFIFIIVLTLLFGSCDTAAAQSSDQRTQSLINALGKTKYKKKEKKNVSIEFYIDIKSEAVVKNNAQDYAGVYQAEDGGHRLELSIGNDGAISGNGYETGLNDSKKQNFTLKDARIKGALLTATKVFAGGDVETLEAVFSNRTVITGKNPNEISTRDTKYGLGYIDKLSSDGYTNTLKVGDEVMTNRVFLEFKP